MELELPGNVVGAAIVCKSEDMDCLPLHCIILAEIIDHRMHRSAVCRLVCAATTSQKSALTSSIGVDRSSTSLHILNRRIYIYRRFALKQTIDIDE